MEPAQNSIIVEGWLLKQSRHFKSWRKYVPLI